MNNISDLTRFVMSKELEDFAELSNFGEASSINNKSARKLFSEVHNAIRFCDRLGKEKPDLRPQCSNIENQLNLLMGGRGGVHNLRTIKENLHVIVSKMEPKKSWF